MHIGKHFNKVIILLMIACLTLCNTSSASSVISSGVSDTNINHQLATQKKRNSINLPANSVNIKSYASYVGSDKDWSKAIARAELSGKHIYFPEGNYKITNYITKKDGVNWYGAGTKSVIYFDNSFHYVKNKNGGYIIVNEHVASANSISDYDTFKIENLTFSTRYTDKASFLIEGFWALGYTNNVVINKVKMDQSLDNAKQSRTFDFRGANINTTVSNCDCIYNSTNGKWGSFTFRNFRKEASTGITIKNNTIARKCGGDESGWICANVGDITNITIDSNTYKVADNTSQSSVIFVLQTDTPSLAGTHKVSDVSIVNNKIYIPRFNYCAIRVGTYLPGYANINNVTIKNNYIQCKFKNDAPNASGVGISLQYTTNSLVEGNTIYGLCKQYISGADVARYNQALENDNDMGIETRGITNCKTVDGNNINVTGIGFVECYELTRNTIIADYNLIQSKRYFYMSKNTFIKTSFTKDYIISTNIIDNTGNRAKPYVYALNNTFYNVTKQIFNGDMDLQLENNTTYNR